MGKAVDEKMQQLEAKIDAIKSEQDAQFAEVKELLQNVVLGMLEKDEGAARPGTAPGVRAKGYHGP